MSTPTALDALTRYTFGYKSDEWGEGHHLGAIQSDTGGYLLREDVLRALAQPAESAPCATCNGHGMIGGPSYQDPGEGGVPCPDCAQPAESAEADSLKQDVENLLAMLEEREYAEHWAKSDLGKRLEDAVTELHNDIHEARESAEAGAAPADAYQHLLHMLGATDHESAARIIAGHHAREIAASPAAPAPALPDLPLALSTSPDHIWLDLGFDPWQEDARFHELAEVTWSADNVTGHGIRYVRDDAALAEKREGADRAK